MTSPSPLYQVPRRVGVVIGRRFVGPTVFQRLGVYEHALPEPTHDAEVLQRQMLEFGTPSPSCLDPWPPLRIRAWRSIVSKITRRN